MARRYIRKEHVDISSYWLFEARYTVYGEQPGWYFWWVNDNGANGNYVEIFVSMDGKTE